MVWQSCVPCGLGHLVKNFAGPGPLLCPRCGTPLTPATDQCNERLHEEPNVVRG
jgi:predicted amidophosphoribosyltransferase